MFVSLNNFYSFPSSMGCNINHCNPFYFYRFLCNPVCWFLLLNFSTVLSPLYSLYFILQVPQSTSKVLVWCYAWLMPMERMGVQNWNCWKGGRIMAILLDAWLSASEGLATKVPFELNDLCSIYCIYIFKTNHRGNFRTLMNLVSVQWVRGRPPLSLSCAWWSTF